MQMSNMEKPSCKKNFPAKRHTPANGCLGWNFYVFKIRDGIG